MTAALSPTDRPRLRRGVRTGTDPLGDRPILLFPEGILFLNDTAAAVIGHCDGSRTVADVMHTIGAIYDGVDGNDILTLVQDLVAQRLMVVDRG